MAQAGADRLCDGLPFLLLEETYLEERCETLSRFRCCLAAAFFSIYFDAYLGNVQTLTYPNRVAGDKITRSICEVCISRSCCRRLLGNYNVRLGNWGDGDGRSLHSDYRPC
jgi:hypothetical protein